MELVKTTKQRGSLEGRHLQLWFEDVRLGLLDIHMGMSNGELDL